MPIIHPDSLKQHVHSLRFGLPAVSTTLCVIGTFANLTFLIYFIKKKDKTIGDKLLMLLNSVDLLLCFIATLATAILSYLHGGKDTGDIAFAIIAIAIPYFLLIDGTAFVTCLLSVTRAIGIVSPFYQIRGKLLVILGISVFVIVEVLQFGLFMLRYPRLLVSLMVLLTVLCATILAVYKLTRADLQGATENVSRNNRKATWTVVILSALFLLFNTILFGVIWFILTNPRSFLLDIQSQPLAFFGLFIAIPLNSSINPIVYLTRRSDMRQFFKQEFRKFYCLS